MNLTHWFYKLGIMAVWPLITVVLLASFAVVLIAAFFFIPTLTVGRDEDGSLKITY